MTRFSFALVGLVSSVILAVWLAGRHRSADLDRSFVPLLPFFYDHLPAVIHDSTKSLSRRRQQRPIPTTNATFDFGRAYVINMDHRHDRLDQLSIMSSLTGITLTRAPGVYVTSRAQTSSGFPPYTPADMPLSKLACFRAHANVWRRFLDESDRPSTALILEDDVDWDVNVKEVMAKLKAPLRALDRTMHGHPIDHTAKAEWTSSSWDILRLGTCREPAHTENFKAAQIDLDALPFTVFEDDSAPDREWTATDHVMLFDAYKIPMSSMHDEHVQPRRRIVQQSNYPVCLHAYAVTRLGAAKMLHLTSQGLIDGANDLTIALATQNTLLRSFSVSPPPFGQWKVQGHAGNSDNGGTNTDPVPDQEGPLAFSWNIRTSVRMEMNETLNTIDRI